MTDKTNDGEAPLCTEAARNSRVLLVDDQPIIAEAIRRMLADQNDIEFHYCRDPSQAVQKAIECEPTVILQDLVMPDVDGMTLLGEYHKTPEIKTVPVIVLSTKEDPAVKKDAFERNANDYLVKLPDKIELIARIHAHSRSYLAHKQRNEAFAALRALQVELENKNAELARLSAMDGLTGILNRRSFDELLEKEWDRAVREKASLSLIMIDIDHFKLFNDNYGHQGGDSCLKKVACQLDSVVQRPADFVARYGGEEFSVVLPGTDVKGAEEIAESLRAAIEKLSITHEYSSTAGYVTISSGVAAIEPKKERLASELIKMADWALYQAKEEGRNRFYTFNNSPA